jgi:phenylacetate-CoA ligase
MISDKIKSSCFFSKFRFYHRDAIPFYRNLMRQQYLSRDELENMNWEKRKMLLSYAYEKVPYYRDKFKSVGLHPMDLKHPEDYYKVPLLKRSDIRENYERLISQEAKPNDLGGTSTGGSTGEPLKVLYDKRVPIETFGWRLRDWWGVSPGLNEASIIRIPKQRAFSRWAISILWWPALKLRLDASCMSAENIEKFLNLYNRVRPRVIWGYVGAVEHIASYLENNRMQINPPNFISVTSSPVSDLQRKRIENAFNAPVCNQYGCCEVFWLGAQCPKRNGLHIFSDGRLIEFTDDVGQPKAENTYGNVVITDLENYNFPFIRYMNGDIGRSLKEKCTCGLSLPLMDKIMGRQTDMIKLPNGACLAGDYLTTIFDEYPNAVKGFQVRQKKDYSLHILYIPDTYSQEYKNVVEKVHQQLIAKTSSQVHITFESVENIPHDRGKLRYVISELS